MKPMKTRKVFFILFALAFSFILLLWQGIEFVLGAPSFMPHSQILMTSTPWPDGSVYHVPQEGDTLYWISEAYGVSIRDINIINGNSPENEELYIGQPLLIMRGQPVTPTMESSPTPIPVTPSATIIKPSRTPIPSKTAVPTPTATEPPTRVQEIFGDSKRVGWTITGISLGGLLLVLVFGFIYKPKH